MTGNYYEQDHLPSRARALTRSDLRVSLALIVIGISALNVTL